jgi:hypothetical protein
MVAVVDWTSGSTWNRSSGAERGAAPAQAIDERLVGEDAACRVVAGQAGDAAAGV